MIGSFERIEGFGLQIGARHFDLIGPARTETAGVRHIGRAEGPAVGRPCAVRAREIPGPKRAGKIVPVTAERPRLAGDRIGKDADARGNMGKAQARLDQDAVGKRPVPAQEEARLLVARIVADRALQSYAGATVNRVGIHARAVDCLAADIEAIGDVEYARGTRANRAESVKVRGEGLVGLPAIAADQQLIFAPRLIGQGEFERFGPLAGRFAAQLCIGERALVVFFAQPIGARLCPGERDGEAGRMSARHIVLQQRLVAEDGDPLRREGYIDAPVEGLFGITGIGQPPDIGSANVTIAACGQPAAKSPFAAVPELESRARCD